MPLNRRRFLKHTGLATLLWPLAGAARPAGAPDPFLWQTPYYRFRLNPREVAFDDFGVDGLGKGDYGPNPMYAWRISTQTRYVAQPTSTGVAYRRADRPATAPPDWSFTFGENTVTLTANYTGQPGEALELLFNQRVNHATLLGRFAPDSQRIALPCVLHAPSRGSVVIEGDAAGLSLGYDARKNIAEPYVRVSFPAATAAQPRVTYRWTVRAIHPALPADRIGDPLYDGFRRGALNAFQLNPRLGVLANNASSDACAFTLYKYAEVARRTPTLAPNLTAMHLLRDSLDRYLAGQKAYGMVGYDRAKDPYRFADIVNWVSPYDTLDSLPSLVIAACYYVRDAPDRAWGQRHYATVKGWLDGQWRTDPAGTGLVKHGETGNSGSWDGGVTRRPANWWDTVGYGHEDAYANALTYHATRLLAEVAALLGHADDSQQYRARAAKLKARYYATFLNPATGLLAGWRSADGQLHDYAFPFVQGVAVYYDLLTPAEGNAVMTRLLAKMQAVGYTDFSLGLPGNLVPIRKADYTHWEKRYGGPATEDGSDAFQIYENGGATACHAFFVVAALQKLGRRAEADTLLRPMLKSFTERRFEGVAPNGMSYDWKDWRGEPNGYEGFLVDSYLLLLAALDAK